MSSFLLYTTLPEGRQCTADICMQINTFSCNAVAALTASIFIVCCFFIPSLCYLLMRLLLFSVCVCLSSFQRSFAFCLYWFNVLFWKYWWRQALHPSQQGSSINKKAALHCTTMAKNKLLSWGLSPCFHSFNDNYLTTCLCVCTWLCAGVSVYAACLYFHLHLHASFLMCFISSVSTAFVWVPLSVSSSVKASFCLIVWHIGRECLAVCPCLLPPQHLLCLPLNVASDSLWVSKGHTEFS